MANTVRPTASLARPKGSPVLPAPDRSRRTADLDLGHGLRALSAKERFRLTVLLGPTFAERNVPNTLAARDVFALVIMDTGDYPGSSKGGGQGVCNLELHGGGDPLRRKLLRA